MTKRKSKYPKLLELIKVLEKQTDARLKEAVKKLRFILYAPLSYKRKINLNGTIEATKLDRIVLKSFIWDKTKEGYNYWKGVWSLLKISN